MDNLDLVKLYNDTKDIKYRNMIIENCIYGAEKSLINFMNYHNINEKYYDELLSYVYEKLVMLINDCNYDIMNKYTSFSQFITIRIYDYLKLIVDNYKENTYYDFYDDNKEVEYDCISSIEDNIIKKELMICLFESCNDLSERNKQILFMRYGIDDNKRYKLEEIAQLYNITDSRVGQIEEQSLKKLNKNFKKNKINSYYDLINKC